MLGQCFYDDLHGNALKSRGVCGGGDKSYYFEKNKSYGLAK